MSYQYQNVLFNKNNKLLNFIFIGNYDFDENVSPILTKIAKNKNYKDLKYIDYIRLQINMQKIHYQKSEQQNITDIDLPNNLFGNLQSFDEIYFINQFINLWDTLYTIKEKIYIECQKYIGFSLQPENLQLNITTINDNKHETKKISLNNYVKFQHYEDFPVTNYLSCELVTNNKKENIVVKDTYNSIKDFDYLIYTSYKYSNKYNFLKSNLLLSEKELSILYFNTFLLYNKNYKEDRELFNETTLSNELVSVQLSTITNKIYKMFLIHWKNLKNKEQLINFKTFTTFKEHQIEQKKNYNLKLAYNIGIFPINIIKKTGKITKIDNNYYYIDEDIIINENFIIDKTKKYKKGDLIEYIVYQNNYQNKYILIGISNQSNTTKKLELTYHSTQIQAFTMKYLIDMIDTICKTIKKQLKINILPRNFINLTTNVVYPLTINKTVIENFSNYNLLMLYKMLVSFHLSYFIMDTIYLINDTILYINAQNNIVKTQIESFTIKKKHNNIVYELSDGTKINHSQILTKLYKSQQSESLKNQIQFNLIYYNKNDLIKISYLSSIVQKDISQKNKKLLHYHLKQYYPELTTEEIKDKYIELSTFRYKKPLLITLNFNYYSLLPQEKLKTTIYVHNLKDIKKLTSINLLINSLFVNYFLLNQQFIEEEEDEEEEEDKKIKEEFISNMYSRNRYLLNNNISETQFTEKIKEEIKKQERKDYNDFIKLIRSIKVFTFSIIFISFGIVILSQRK